MFKEPPSPQMATRIPGTILKTYVKNGLTSSPRLKSPLDFNAKGPDQELKMHSPKAADSNKVTLADTETTQAMQ